MGSGAKKKGARKNKSEGGGEAPLSPAPLYFLSLSLLRTALHYLNAWNRLRKDPQARNDDGRRERLKAKRGGEGLG